MRLYTVGNNRKPEFKLRAIKDDFPEELVSIAWDNSSQLAIASKHTIGLYNISNTKETGNEFVEVASVGNLPERLNNIAWDENNRLITAGKLPLTSNEENNVKRGNIRLLHVSLGIV